MRQEKDQAMLSRRKFIEAGSAAVVTAAGLQAAQGQRGPQKSQPDASGTDVHTGINESQPGVSENVPMARENADSAWPPETDSGGQPPFKYPFSLAHRRVEAGGWTRQVTVRDLAVSKKMAGVQMRLISGGVRELHWHKASEWAMMLYGAARITAVDQQGRSFVSDVHEGDLWLFPGGIPHSIQGLGPDGCTFLLVFNDGNFDEFGTFLLTDWMHHTPGEVLAKNFGVPESTFDKVPKRELFIFPSELPRPLAEERKQTQEGTGPVPNPFDFKTGGMPPSKTSKGGEVKIVDRKNFPATDIAAAIVTLKPGGLRELHWHPNDDEWQYYVRGKARMTVFAAGGKARTMDFEGGDVGYVDQAMPHYVENTGDTDLEFIEVFPTPYYEDVSLAMWLAHTPYRLTNEHIGVGEEFLSRIPNHEVVVLPE